MTFWGIEHATFRQIVLHVTRKGNREKRKSGEDVEDELQEMSVPSWNGLIRDDDDDGDDDDCRLGF
jgi:hypothetical protein